MKKLMVGMMLMPVMALADPELYEVDGITWRYFVVNGGVEVEAAFDADFQTPAVITIPSTINGHKVTGIANSAFYNNLTIQTVVMPQGVERIGVDAFSYSTVSSVRMSEGVRYIEASAFFSCGHLKTIEIPEGVVSISDSAFGWGGLTSATFPSSVRYIGRYAFADGEGSNTIRLKEVTYKGLPPVGLLCTPVDATVRYDGAHAEAWRAALYNAGCASKQEYLPGTAPQPSSTEIVIVTNVVVHYVLNSVQPEFAIQPADDMNFVNIITEVKGSAAVAIPETWAANYPGFTEKFGTDFTQALLKPSGKIGTGGTPMLVWQDYVAGTDPTNEKDVFTASITIVDGKVMISYTPELDDARKAMRKYTTWGKTSLMDTDWTEVQDGHEAEYNFFKVSVEMR